VRALCEGLRQEVKPYNIRTTVISPGAVTTELLDHISEGDVQTANRDYVGKVGVSAATYARMVGFAIGEPADVDVNEIVFRPTAQELQDMDKTAQLPSVGETWLADFGPDTPLGHFTVETTYHSPSRATFLVTGGVIEGRTETMDYTTTKVRDGLYVVRWTEPEAGPCHPHRGLHERDRDGLIGPRRPVHPTARHLVEGALTAFSRVEIYGGRVDARQMAQIGQDGE
jgi:hypothetical protein